MGQTGRELKKVRPGWAAGKIPVPSPAVFRWAVTRTPTMDGGDQDINRRYLPVVEHPCTSVVDYCLSVLTSALPRGTGGLASWRTARGSDCQMSESRRELGKLSGATQRLFVLPVCPSQEPVRLWSPSCSTWAEANGHHLKPFRWARI